MANDPQLNPLRTGVQVATDRILITLCLAFCAGVTVLFPPLIVVWLMAFSFAPALWEERRAMHREQRTRDPRQNMAKRRTVDGEEEHDWSR